MGLSCFLPLAPVLPLFVRWGRRAFQISLMTKSFGDEVHLQLQRELPVLSCPVLSRLQSTKVCSRMPFSLGGLVFS